MRNIGRVRTLIFKLGRVAATVMQPCCCGQCTRNLLACGAVAAVEYGEQVAHVKKHIIPAAAKSVFVTNTHFGLDSPLWCKKTTGVCVLHCWLGFSVDGNSGR